ncbi:uncharacterized protein LOC124144991 [Haliotis rufescens]|uniref:uncharacterized protein LOC124144991 n=1 Tax=Haliotis rufescens TaxID=6454 RepID=UPI00201EDF38|nr:uncharacterized protein LOC124144991 [Haliotis rufescens]XP_046370576.2 uncharacterized protein LOC124144991 [Haliotis rufescens]XP_048241142.1 uncharacterized protein LOC124144991 [Haliotis rufescens]
MGIRGLLSYCREHIPTCADTIDLVEVARQRDGILILVDFFSFEHLILEHFWRGLSDMCHNPYLQFDGGEYKTIDAYLSKFVNDLKSLGIGLVFYVDGAKGSSYEGTKQKLETWQKRHMEEVQRLREITDMCQGKFPVEHLHHEARMRPVLLEIQVKNTLTACGCIVHQLPSGEADYVIAQELQTNQKALAVLSNDTDFLVFRNGAMISNEMFDIHGDLQLGRPILLPEKPLRLVCHVLKAEKVAWSLGLMEHRQIVELSIVAGNDFTGPFMWSGLHHSLGIEGYPTIQKLASWVKNWKSVENHPALLNRMQRDHQFAAAVTHTRNFYMLTCPAVDKSAHGFIHNLLWEGIQHGTFSPHVLGLHNGFYWRRMLVEESAHGHPSSEVALVGLRTYIYRMVLPIHKHQVTEFGRSDHRDYEDVRINATEDRMIPSINNVKPQEIFKNLKHFDRIMSHQEPQAFPKTWFDRYGRKNGFICYILRYFLVQNWDYNLRISENEFLALVAIAFGHPDEAWYQRLRLRPSPRCVTVGNWFQNIYRHAFLFVGKLLYLTHEFPLPKEIFSGSVWTAFHACCSDEEWHAGLRRVSSDALMRVQHEMDAVIREKRHMVRYLTEYVFDFDDRY